MAEVPLTTPAGDSTPWLECVAILLYLVNCMILLVYMRIYQPGIVEIFVVAFFIVEMLIKMLVMEGFGYEGSYLSDCWSMLNLFINLAVLFYYFLQFLNVTALYVLWGVERMCDGLTLILDNFMRQPLFLHLVRFLYLFLDLFLDLFLHLILIVMDRILGLLS